MVIGRTVLHITISSYTQDGPVNSENTKMCYMQDLCSILSIWQVYIIIDTSLICLVP